VRDSGGDPQGPVAGQNPRRVRHPHDENATSGERDLMVIVGVQVEAVARTQIDDEARR
jgi:hypothetical protein